MSQEPVEAFEFKVAVNPTGEHGGEVLFDSKPTLPISSPSVFGGDADRYSPQELFVASVAACFLTTFTSYAKRMKVTLKSLQLDGRGVVQRDAASGWRFTDIFVVMHIGVGDVASKSAALRAAELTEKYCMVSRSVRCQVHLESLISIAP